MGLDGDEPDGARASWRRARADAALYEAKRQGRDRTTLSA